jgi:tRNA G18 (ribose-2'-O)-methylase SpoU
MRTSQLCGVNKYIIFGRKKYDKRSTTGAHHYVNVVACEALDNEYIEKGEYKLDPKLFLEVMDEHKLVPVFLEQEPGSIIFSDVNWNKQLKPIKEIGREICFIFGNEGDGIPPYILEAGKKIPGSFVITISQLGVSKSFNVAASAAIVLYNFKEFMMKKRLDYIV